MDMDELWGFIAVVIAVIVALALYGWIGKFVAEHSKSS